MSITTERSLDLEFRRLAEHDENLIRLVEDARNCPAHGANFCAMDAWEDGFKQRVVDMAGRHRAYGGPDCLRTPRAYEVTVQVVLKALPPCRGDCRCGESRAAS